MTETPDSKYFDATAVSVNAEYEECAPLVDLMKSTVRPAYDVRLTVKEAVPASLVTHDVIIDVDVSEVELHDSCCGSHATSYRELCTVVCVGPELQRQSTFQEKGITSKVTINFKEEDLYPPIFSELYYTAVIEDPSVGTISQWPVLLGYTQYSLCWTGY